MVLGVLYAKLPLSLFSVAVTGCLRLGSRGKKDVHLDTILED